MAGESDIPVDRIVAVGLLTQRELDLLGPAFDRAWAVEDTPCFSGLLRAIDEADREIRKTRPGFGAGAGEGPAKPPG